MRFEVVEKQDSNEGGTVDQECVYLILCFTSVWILFYSYYITVPFPLASYLRYFQYVGCHCCTTCTTLLQHHHCYTALKMLPFLIQPWNMTHAVDLTRPDLRRTSTILD